jgi:hypothetical protein
MAKQMYQPDWQNVSAICVAMADGQVSLKASLEE